MFPEVLKHASMLFVLVIWNAFSSDAYLYSSFLISFTHRNIFRRILSMKSIVMELWKSNNSFGENNKIDPNSYVYAWLSSTRKSTFFVFIQYSRLDIENI